MSHGHGNVWVPSAWKASGAVSCTPTLTHLSLHPFSCYPRRPSCEVYTASAAPVVMYAAHPLRTRAEETHCGPAPLFHDNSQSLKSLRDEIRSHSADFQMHYCATQPPGTTTSPSYLCYPNIKHPHNASLAYLSFLSRIGNAYKRFITSRSHDSAMGSPSCVICGLLRCWPKPRS